MSSARAANSGVGPRQRSSSTSRNNGASVLSVASRLNRRASSWFSSRIEGGERLDAAVLPQQTGRRDRADAGHAWVAVGRVAHECEVVRYLRRLDPELVAHALRVAYRLAATVNLHYAIVPDALRQILVGCPDADLLDALVRLGEMCGGGETVVGLELDHRPHRAAHRRQRVLERTELPMERALQSFAGLVTRPEVVAERLDDMVGGHADVSCPGLHHLQHCTEHARDRSVRRILALGEPAEAVEVAKQLVGAVEQMYDHAAVYAPSGWIGVWLDGKPDWTELADLVTDAYRLVAPKERLSLLEE